MTWRKPLPDHAKKVFKGEVFEVWQWEQELYNGETAVFERLRRPDTAIIIPVVNGNIMVVDEEQPDTGPFLSVPSGRIEDGESPQDGAARELLEETGYASDDWELLAAQRPSGKIEWTIHIYVARACRKVKEQELDGGEKITPRLVSFEKFLMLSDDPAFRAQEVTDMLLRARLDPQKSALLKKKLGC
jgi:ADP-ribose pyrophosphatase